MTNEKVSLLNQEVEYREHYSLLATQEITAIELAKKIRECAEELFKHRHQASEILDRAIIRLHTIASIREDSLEADAQATQLQLSNRSRL